MGEECCKRCCYSTPYATLFAVSVAIVGLVGFVAASIYGVVMINGNQDLNRQVVVFAPILAGVVVVGVVPLLLATIMGYCVTGYIRDELYSNNIKRCIGPCCSFFVMLLTFMYLLLWVLVAVALGAVLTVFVELRLGCSFARTNDPDLASMNTCLPAGDYGSTILSQVCGSNLQSLCTDGENAGLSYIVALGFSLVIIIGLVMLLMIQMGNYVNARENMEYRKSYQPRTNGTNSAEEDYAMKRVR